MIVEFDIGEDYRERDYRGSRVAVTHGGSVGHCHVRIRNEAETRAINFYVAATGIKFKNDWSTVRTFPPESCVADSGYIRIAIRTGNFLLEPHAKSTFALFWHGSKKNAYAMDYREYHVVTNIRFIRNSARQQNRAIEEGY